MGHMGSLLLACVVTHFLFVTAHNTQLADELETRQACAETRPERVTWLMSGYMQWESARSDNRTDSNLPVSCLGRGVVTSSDSLRMTTTGSSAERIRGVFVDPWVGHGIRVKRDDPFRNSDSYLKSLMTKMD